MTSIVYWASLEEQKRRGGVKQFCLPSLSFVAAYPSEEELASWSVRVLSTRDAIIAKKRLLFIHIQ
jgi:hypothetical protein